MACIVVTTPTSGTASMQRIIRKIATRSYGFIQVPSPATDRPDGEGTYLDPDADMIYWFQGNRYWNPSIDLSSFKLIVHMRDPRDLVCNQYWWALQHPNTTDPPEVAAAIRQQTEADGIHKFAIARDNRGAYSMHRDVSLGPHGDTATYTSYAQLCCAFDLLMYRVCKLFGRSPAEVAPGLRFERPEALTANPNWVKVGGTWQGADVTPGRFRKELRKTVIAELNTRYANELAMMRQRDAAFLAHHYEP